MTAEIYDMDFWKTLEIDLNHTIAGILRSRSRENVSNVSKSYTLSLSLRRKFLKWPECQSRKTLIATFGVTQLKTMQGLRLTCEAHRRPEN